MLIIVIEIMIMMMEMIVIIVMVLMMIMFAIIAIMITVFTILMIMIIETFMTKKITYDRYDVDNACKFVIVRVWVRVGGCIYRSIFACIA